MLIDGQVADIKIKMECIEIVSKLKVLKPFDGVKATWSNPSVDCLASSNTLAVPAPTTPICTFGELAALRYRDQQRLDQGKKGNEDKMFTNSYEKLVIYRVVS